MLYFYKNLNDFFIERTKNLPAREDTKAYITGIFTHYADSSTDLSKKSLTIQYASAKNEYNFEKFQNIADWLLFINTLYPESLNNASEEYYISLARNSYYKCFLMVNKKWLCFEELSDCFPNIINNLHKDFL